VISIIIAGMMSPWKAESLPDVRRFAVCRVREGQSPGEVAESLRVTRRSVERWVRAWADGGDVALDTAPRPGRPPKLDDEQAREVLQWVRRNPCDFGFATERWTAPRVAAVLRRRLGVVMNHRYLNEWLARRGITPQTPPRQAKERDDGLIERWVGDEWPRIKKRPTTSAQPWLLRTKPGCSWPR
jgi:transposase